MSFEHIDETNFTEQVLKSPKPFILEFGAVWCQPCKRLEPELERLQKTFGEKARLGKLDVDESTEITTRYSILSVPTTMLFVGGEVVERVTGYQPLPRLMDKFESHI